MAQIGIVLPNTLLVGLDGDHRYNVYIQALETIRLSLDVSEERFYLSLLATSLADRPAKTLMQARQLSVQQWRTVLEIISVANATLKTAF